MRDLLQDRAVRTVLGGFPVIKGGVLAVVSLAVTSNLGDALIVAAVSGFLGLVGMLGAAYISSRAYRRQIHPDLRDLKSAAGIDKRQTDDPGRPARDDDEC